MNVRSKMAMIVAVLWIVLWLPSASIKQAQAAQTDLPINPATRTQVIEAVLSRLNESYVLPEIAARMEQSIRARMRKGEYDKIISSALLAQTLTAHLGEIAKDKHLGVGFSYDPIPISSTGLPFTTELKLCPRHGVDYLFRYGDRDNVRSYSSRRCGRMPTRRGVGWPHVATP